MLSNINLLILATLALQATAAPVPCFNSANAGWKQLIRTGQAPGGSPIPLGTAADSQGNVINEKGAPLVSNNPDFTSLIAVGNELFSVTQFESPNPSSMHLLTLAQDKTTGALSVTSTRPIDTSKVKGVWTLCAGSVTPWNSHLAGEEYEPDARALDSATCVLNSTCGSASWERIDGDFTSSREFVRYFGLNIDENTTLDQVKAVFNPYLYGLAVEVAVQAGGNYSIKKWHTLGRLSFELPYIMPDDKTVYMTDDGERVGFFKFVADRPRDLSSGTIYAVKANQVSAENGGRFVLEWVRLASATQAELEALAVGLKFSNIFATASYNNGCPSGFRSVNVGARGLQCLQLKVGMEKAAAFFETRRYAAYLGATTEFSKWEGFTFSMKRNTAYTAMSEIRRGMEDNADKTKPSTSYDIGGPNHVRLGYNPCGCVYKLRTDANYNIYGMEALVCGKPVSGDPKNICDINGIANPDNLAIINDQDILMIGEDTTTGHQNDVMWAYHLKLDMKFRVLDSPYGSEVTSAYWYKNINGFAYLVTVIQHPYGETDQELSSTTVNPNSEGNAGYLGYWVFKSEEIQDGTLFFYPIDAPLDNAAKSKTISTTEIKICPRKALSRNLVNRLMG